jgi:thioredoxin reductase (NADPH)
MQQRVFDNPKIEVLRHTEGKEIIGDGNMMTGIVVINNQTGQETTLDAGGLFYAIGHTPNTGFLDGQLALDESGYIITQP